MIGKVAVRFETVRRKEQAMESGKERIRAQGIASAYGKRQVLNNLSLMAAAGECVGIVGANGCGKTTLFQILSGLRRADAGSVCFDGNRAGRRVDFLRKVGYVPQQDNLVAELSVWDNLRLWYPDRSTLERQLEEGFLRVLGVRELCHLAAGKLSGGQRKKVSIGCAMAENPTLLLLDEPCAALDLAAKNEVRSYLTLFKEEGGTVLLTTHEEMDLGICDRLYVIRAGAAYEVSPTLRGEELLKEYKGVQA